MRGRARSADRSATAQVDLDDLADGAARSGAAGVRVDHAGEQRDRRDPAGARGGGAGARSAAGCCIATPSQAPGRIALDMAELGADMLTLSAHKIGGVLGRWARWCVEGDLAVRAAAGRRRPGEVPPRRHRECSGDRRPSARPREAARDACAQASRVAALRDRLEGAVLPQRSTHGAGPAMRRGCRTPSASQSPGKSSETQVMALDLAGLCDQRRVGLFIGKGHGRATCRWRWATAKTIARSAIRVSLGWWNTEAEIDGLGGATGDLAGRQRSYAAATCSRRLEAKVQ